ncbi:hypothetical protein CCR79_04125 [Halorhodospira halophila]|nr:MULTISPECIES: DUF86 domain-containing protein [Halorhodospira]MBK5943059.1 hypothetical protein [Halorhodospira halophila]
MLDKKLAFIESRVQELRELAQPELVGHDLRETRFVEHTLQLAIQAALDAASQVVSAKRLGEPETNRALFEHLGRYGIIEPDLVEPLAAMAGFRNVLVHGYQEVDARIVRDVVENHLDDLLAFVEALRGQLL